MPIIFENIDNHQTISVDRESEGKYYGAKLSAAINSSNLGTNHDRGQDYGWRLQPEQQAIIEDWESDGEMIDKVSAWSHVSVDGLTHAEFLSYLLKTQEAGKSQDRTEIAERRANQAEYNARVEALRTAKVLEPMAPFKPLTLEDFLGDDAPEKRALLKEQEAKAAEAEATAEALPAGDWSGDQSLNDPATEAPRE